MGTVLHPSTGGLKKIKIMKSFVFLISLFVVLSGYGENLLNSASEQEEWSAQKVRDAEEIRRQAESCDYEESCFLEKLNYCIEDFCSREKYVKRGFISRNECESQYPYVFLKLFEQGIWSGLQVIEDYKLAVAIYEGERYIINEAKEEYEDHRYELKDAIKYYEEAKENYKDAKYHSDYEDAYEDEEKELEDAVEERRYAEDDYMDAKYNYRDAKANYQAAKDNYQEAVRVYKDFFGL